jgi:Helicase HerA, central domain
MNQRPLTIEEICNKLRPIFGKKIDEIYLQYTIADGREEKEEFIHILNTLYQKHLNQLLDKSVLLEPPKQQQINGTYELATISYAQKKLFPFTLREQDWPRHICITGMSGSGKTTFAFKIIEALNTHKKPYLIFDWKKSFRSLSAEDNTIMTFTVGNEKVTNLFKTNINQPPKNVAPKEWINVLSDFLTEAFSASFGVHKVILETLDEAFKEWGIYHNSKNYPTWNHIKWRLQEKLEKANNRESGWIESALRIATVLTFGEFGKTLNYKGKDSFTVEELLDKKVVMELNSLGGIEKTVFCEFILTYIYKLKKAKQNQADFKFDHAIIVDEAHNIFLKKPTNFTNETTTDMIYREMREYGTSLICLDQHISKLSDTVKGNSATNIAFQQQLPQDISDISDIMSLRENRQYFSQLPVGNAIVKLAERYTQPFLIEVPYVNMRMKNVTDQEIIFRMQSLMINKDYKEKKDPEFNKQIEKPLSKPRKKRVTTTKLTEGQKLIYDYIDAHLKAGIPLEQIKQILEKSKIQGNYNSNDISKAINLIPEDQPDDRELTDEETSFLDFLQENPNHNLATTQVYKQIGLSARKGTNIKKKLEEKGLIKIEEIKYEKGWKKIIQLV